MDIYVFKKSKIQIPDDLTLKKFEYKQYRNYSKRFEHALTYYLLDELLKEKYNLNDREIEFINNKPFLKNRKLFFSLSHSHDYIAIGISEVNCGIDIELRRQRDFKLICKRMNFVSQTLDEFYKDWTEFEAKYKLKATIKSKKYYEIENYAITAVTSIFDDDFNINIQN